jgi:hypothetical protein
MRGFKRLFVVMSFVDATEAQGSPASWFQSPFTRAAPSIDYSLTRHVQTTFKPSEIFVTMERTTHLERIAADMLHECPELCEKLGLDGLARLATCSKASRDKVEAFLVRNSPGLLDRAVNTARQSEQQQHKQAVAWLAAVLLRQAPALAVDVSEPLLHLPSVPLATAEQLLAAGMRVSYAQLLDAAHSMVAGVEVWVQAQQHLGVHTDIPALVVAICHGEDWVSYGCTRIGRLHLAVCQGCCAPAANGQPLADDLCMQPSAPVGKGAPVWCAVHPMPNDGY